MARGNGENETKTCTHPNLFVLCACREVLSIGTKANTPDVQISILVNGLILQFRDLVAGGDFEYLSGSVAACCDISSVVAKSDTANNTFMSQVVDEVDIEDTARTGIKDRKPIKSFTFLVRAE